MIPNGKSSHEYSVNACVPQSSVFGSTVFLPYINDLHLNQGVTYVSMLGKLSLFHLTIQIPEALLMWKWIDLSLVKTHFLKMLLSYCLSCWNYLQKGWYVLWSFFLLRLLFNHYKSTPLISGLMSIVATWICWISYRKEYVGEFTLISGTLDSM